MILLSGLTEANVGKVLDWAYEKAVNGIPGTDTAYELAESYLSKDSDVEVCINSLVKWKLPNVLLPGL